MQRFAFHPIRGSGVNGVILESDEVGRILLLRGLGSDGVHRRRLIDANPAGGVLSVFADYRSRGLRNEILIDHDRRGLRRLLVNVGHRGLTATVIGVTRNANGIRYVDDVTAAASA